ncbi:MAG: ribonuclease HII [Puniceicoccaceae bacterium]
MPVGLVGFDKRTLDGAACLVGIDEAGRGCLAGPVVAAAVRCEASFYSTSWCRRNSRGVNDSKCLTPEKRAAVVDRFRKACHEKWIQIGIGEATVEEIEEHNIYHANSLAMRRALEQVLDLREGTLWDSDSGEGPVTILIDGRPIRTFPVPHQGIVKGDRCSLAIALAGIHAKEHRDAVMRKMDRDCPGYGFAVHKGYGTSQHVEALRQLGPSPHHRPSFLSKVLPERGEQAEHSQDSLF